jgi:hypothetical protein
MKSGDAPVIELMSEAAHDLVYDRETRLLKGGTLSYRDGKGERRTIRVDALRPSYLFAATGYAVAGTALGAGDDWRHGKYMGASWASVKRFDLADPQARASIGAAGVHMLCRLELDTGEVGFADVENTVRNYTRYGL